MSKAQGKFDFSVHHPFKGTLKRRMLTYGQKTSQGVSYMTS